MQNATLKLVPDYVTESEMNAEGNELEIPVQPKSSSGKESVIFSLMSTSGGSGVTTIAIQMAYQLARQQPSAKIALLSLDFENSALPLFLDVAPKISIDNFCQLPSVLDGEICGEWMSVTKFGFDILALPTSISGNERVNADTVVTFLDIMAGQYDYLVLDVPRLWMPWTRATLGASNKLGMVCELSVPNLHMTREKCSALIKAVDQLTGIEILMNKFEKRGFRNSVKLPDAKKAFLTMPIHTICAAGDKAREAINRGEPLSVSYKGTQTAKDIGAVLEAWLAEINADSEPEVEFV